MRNFVHLYRPMAIGWMLLENSPNTFPRLVAEGSRLKSETVYEPKLWEQFAKMVQPRSE